MKPTQKRIRGFDGIEEREWAWPSHDKILWKAAPEVSAVAKVLPLVKGRKLCVQAGGGGGVYPVRLAKEFEKVITFEVFPKNIECLKQNIPGNVTLIEAAIGKDNAKRQFREWDQSNSGAGYLDGDGDTPSIRLDDLNLEACDLIWLDIQGHESEAIIGGLETIRKFHPVMVLEEAMISYMKKWGYTEKTAGDLLLAEGYRRADKHGADVVYTWI